MSIIVMYIGASVGSSERFVSREEARKAIGGPRRVFGIARCVETAVNVRRVKAGDSAIAVGECLCRNRLHCARVIGIEGRAIESLRAETGDRKATMAVMESKQMCSKDTYISRQCDVAAQVEE